MKILEGAVKQVEKQHGATPAYFRIYKRRVRTTYIEDALLLHEKVKVNDANKGKLKLTQI